VDISIVVAVYNEDPRNLLALLERMYQVISPLGLSYEIVFVNDGSRAKTSAALRQIASQVDNVKLINLSRNFGQQAAITAGMDHSDGTVVVNIDSDLQDPPELIPEMIQRWRQGYDVVYAQRSTRRDRFAKQFSAHLFYRVLAALSSVDIPRDTGDFRLLDRKVVDALASMPERTRFLRGLIPWLGFRQIGIAIDRGAREVGETTYTLKKLLQLALDGLLSFSVAPLYLVPMIGLFVTAVGLMLLAVSGFVNPSNLILPAVVAFSGIQILCTGVITIYLSKVLDEVRGRPTYVAAEKLGLGFQSKVFEDADSVEESEETPECGEVKVVAKPLSRAIGSEMEMAKSAYAANQYASQQAANLNVQAFSEEAFAESALAEAAGKGNVSV
jgi:dolichol-phosphate mannosyltransferase